MRMPPSLIALALLASSIQAAETVRVDTADRLAAAVRDAPPGTVIEVAAGTYALEAVLELKTGMTLKGAGIDRTVLTHAENWRPATTALPDPEMKLEGLDTDAYLIRLQRDTAGVTISDLTLRAPRLHGAVFAWFHTGLHLHHVRFQETLWCGLRTFGMKQARIHDCEFIDAGGRWERGRPGDKGGITGGGIFAVWMSDCEVNDNRFERTRPEACHEFYGIKVRQSVRSRFHHNTIRTNFSMEFPFENDEDNEIDHNFLAGTVSIPKHAGGAVPASGRTFHIHHNLFRDTYSIEFVRNGVEIDHNLFDFDPARDHGNLISAFGQAPAPGPASFHHNRVNNPGRGVVWINEVFNRLDIHNNHVRCRTTATPRTDGLFGFNPACDFATLRIRDNIIECEGRPRPLLRAPESYRALIENNRLTNVSDTEKFANAPADRPVGPGDPVPFECGLKGGFQVNGWEVQEQKP